MKKNVLPLILSHRKQLAICSCSNETYGTMQYYIVVNIWDVELEQIRGRGFGLENGYFVRNSHGNYDFFPIYEFNKIFIIVDSCEDNSICKHLNKNFEWLRNNKNINVYIRPVITSDGYSFSYTLEVKFPFYSNTYTERDHFTYELAAKKAMQIVKKECHKHYGKEGIVTWLSFLVVKKH